MSFIGRPTVTLVACYIYKRLLIMCFHHQTHQKWFLLATSIFPNSTGTPTVDSPNATLLSDIIHDNFLFQLVKDPTRNGNILDLVFVLSFDLVYDLKVGLPFSDHNSISMLLSGETVPWREIAEVKLFVEEGRLGSSQESFTLHSMALCFYGY